MASKVYYFTTDYSSKHGVVKKGDSLTGSISTTKNPKVTFDFFEKIDPVKAESGEGIFSISVADLKNFATDVPPTTDNKSATANTTNDTTKKVEEEDKTKKGFSGWSTTKKTLVVGGGLLAVGLAVWYFVIRKK